MCINQTHRSQFPTDDFDVTDLRYWFRHSSSVGMRDVIGSAAPANADANANANANSTAAPGANHTAGGEEIILGHELRFQPIVSRFAAAHEIDKDPEFEECETPVILYSTWTMNMAESLASLPPMVWVLNNTGAFRTRNVRFALPTPQKLPLESFNEWTIQPYSDHKPVSFAELSALRFANGSSHEACFRKAVLVKVVGGDYPRIPMAADAVWSHYKDKASDRTLTDSVLCDCGWVSYLLPPAPARRCCKPSVNCVSSGLRPSISGPAFAVEDQGEERDAGGAPRAPTCLRPCLSQTRRFLTLCAHRGVSDAESECTPYFI